MATATGQVDLPKMAVALIVVIVGGGYFWAQYGPLLSSYRLLPGHFACPTESAVVQVRGARMLLGGAGAALLAERNQCVEGPKTLKMRSYSRFGVSQVTLDAATMYVDHGGFEKL